MGLDFQTSGGRVADIQGHATSLDQHAVGPRQEVMPGRHGGQVGRRRLLDESPHVSGSQADLGIA